MKTRLCLPVIVFLLSGLFLSYTSCKSDKSKKAAAGKEVVRTTLFDKTLPEVKKLVDGEWELVSCKNATEEGEFENTFITFKGDDYVWTENGVSEPGELNWRLEDPGVGYEAWMMDVFYATAPSFPLSISGDTLYIQDCTKTAYMYTLVKKK